ILDKLNPWQFDQTHRVWTAQAASASVTVGVDYSISLWQDTSLVRCDNDGQPRELDLFILPQKMSQPIPLTCSAISQELDVEMSFAHANKLLPACRVSQGGMLIGIILTNTFSHQTVFYQMNIRTGSLLNGIIQSGVASDKLGWYFSRNPFGVDDFSIQFPISTTRLRTSIDLLSRLKVTLADAPLG